MASNNDRDATYEQEHNYNTLLSNSKHYNYTTKHYKNITKYSRIEVVSGKPYDPLQVLYHPKHKTLYM